MFDNLQGMADSALARGLWDEAAGLYQRCIERYGNSSDEPIVADCLRGIARADIARGRFAEAERAANRALAIDEDYWGGGCSQVGESYFIMGEAARYQGALGRAEFFYLESLTVKRAHLGEEHIDVVWVRARIGLLGLIHGLYPDLDVILRSCYETFRVRPPTAEFIEFLDLPSTLRMLVSQRRQGEADDLYRTAQAALEQLFGRNNVESSNLARSYSHIQREILGSAASLTSWHKQVTVAAVVNEENFERRAQEFIANGHYSKAESVYLLHLRLARERHGEVSAEVRHVLVNYATLLRRLERDAEAAAIEKTVAKNF
ncbi:MAG: tetratricopeptide repeat protein [Cyanobacteria bacterium SZAS LIN-2]|nr:tetratricopeptide repeat protein [Cyanobacteria bacterium SZAS LIN-2]